MRTIRLTDQQYAALLALLDATYTDEQLGNLDALVDGDDEAASELHNATMDAIAAATHEEEEEEEG